MAVGIIFFKVKFELTEAFRIALWKKKTVEIKIGSFKVWGTTTLRRAAQSNFCDGGEGFLEMYKVSRTKCIWKRASFFREFEDAASSRTALVGLCAVRIASCRIGDGWRAPLQTWNVNGTKTLNYNLFSQKLASAICLQKQADSQVFYSVLEI